MPLTLQANLQLGTLTAPPYFILPVDGAATPAVPNYQSIPPGGGFDGWLAEGATATVTNGGSLVGIRGQSMAALVEGRIYRDVSALTVGTSYDFDIELRPLGAANEVSIQLRTTAGVILARSPWAARTDYFATVRARVTATAPAGGVLRLVVATRQPMTIQNQPEARIVTARLRKSWPGTVITRTDDNGTDVPVRLAPGQDVDTFGSMIVPDFEAAMTGTVIYTVTTGNYAQTSAYTSMGQVTGSPAGVNGHLVHLIDPTQIDPSSPFAIPPWTPALAATAWSEVSTADLLTQGLLSGPEQLVTGRGLGPRTLTAQLLCSSYTAARAVRKVCAGGTVRLSQPRYPGADAYLAVRSLTQAEGIPGGRLWVLTLTGQEVPAP